MVKGLSTCSLIIPSEGRAKTATAPSLFPMATLVVCKKEAPNYAKRFPNQIHTIPDDFVGIGALRNYCVKQFANDNQAICIIDDSVTGCRSVTDKLFRELSPGEMHDVIQSTALAAKESGAPLFGFSEWGPYKPNDFIRLSGWMSSIIGVTGKHEVWDETLTVGMDVDAALNALCKSRHLWIDTRFSFQSEQDSSLPEGKKSVTKDLDRICRKWGKHIEIVTLPEGRNIIIHVQRRQKLAQFFRNLNLQAEE